MTEPTRWINDENQALQPALLSTANRGGSAARRFVKVHSLYQKVCFKTILS